MARSRSILGMLIVLMLVGAAGYGIWWRLNPAEEETEEETPERSAAADSVVQSVQEQFNTEVPVPVEGAETLQDTLRISVTAKGRAEPIREAQLKARASGDVARVYVQENQTVWAGQPSGADRHDRIRARVGRRRRGAEQGPGGLSGQRAR